MSKKQTTKIEVKLKESAFNQLTQIMADLHNILPGTTAMATIGIDDEGCSNFASVSYCFKGDEVCTFAINHPEAGNYLAVNADHPMTRVFTLIYAFAHLTQKYGLTYTELGEERCLTDYSDPK